MRPLFLYGTLRHRPVLDALTGGVGDAVAREAALSGHTLECEEGGVLPVLVEQAEGSADGVLWDRLPEAASAAIRAYEERIGHEARTVTVVVEDERIEATAWFPPPDVEASGVGWSLEGWEQGELGRAVAAAREVAAQEPPLRGADLRRQWGMIAHRAHAAERAWERVPTRHRRRAAPGDATLRRLRPAAGAFFRFEALDVAHRRFDGGRAEGLPREVLVGSDAALVLPYDRARDRVLLVEQFRIGPARRGDPQPWVLEPVAGLIDAGESPEEAARREAVEEARLDGSMTLVRMFAGYASPGNSTDHFYAFLGLCDLPDDHPTRGGLVEESEDLALHVLPAEEAIGLVDTGEANAVPLVAMLLWLARWRG